MIGLCQIKPRFQAPPRPRWMFLRIVRYRWVP